MIDDELGPTYENVTMELENVFYNVDMSREYWELTKRASFTELRQEERAYTLRDENIVKGKITEVKSCETAPRVMVNITDSEGYNHCLEAKLVGGTSKLGVALMGVIKIDKPNEK